MSKEIRVANTINKILDHIGGSDEKLTDMIYDLIAALESN